MAGAWKVRELFKLSSTFDRINTCVQALLSPAIAVLSTCLALIYLQHERPVLSAILLLPIASLAVSGIVLDVSFMGGKLRRDCIPRLVAMTALQWIQLRIVLASFNATIHGTIALCLCALAQSPDILAPRNARFPFSRLDFDMISDIFRALSFSLAADDEASGDASRCLASRRGQHGLRASWDQPFILWSWVLYKRESHSCRRKSD